jgi:hypothetical protein
MPMPYRIELADGHRAEVTRDRAPPDWPKGEPWKRPAEREYVTNRVQVKVYPDGRRVEASEEEVAVAQHVAELERTLGVRDATIQMACDRLGGLVEGSPPRPLNFLQRIDELVSVEKGATTEPAPVVAQQPAAAPAPATASRRGNR